MIFYGARYEFSLLCAEYFRIPICIPILDSFSGIELFGNPRPFVVIVLGILLRTITTFSRDIFSSIEARWSFEIH